jgi:hypothetical protein
MFANQVGLKSKNMPKFSSHLASKLYLVGIPGVCIIDEED